MRFIEKRPFISALGITAIILMCVFPLSVLFGSLKSTEKRLQVIESNIKDLQESTRILMIEKDKTVEIIVETMNGEIKKWKVIEGK